MAATDAPATLSELIDSHRLAWAAGIVDGEGSINLRQAPSRGYWELRVAVGNTDPRMVVLLREMFGGSVSTYQPKGNRRLLWKWHVSNRLAEKCLRQIMPWLVTKKDQADLGLRSRELILPKRGRVGRFRSPGVDETSSDLAVKMRALRIGDEAFARLSRGGD